MPFADAIEAKIIFVFKRGRRFRRLPDAIKARPISFLTPCQSLSPIKTYVSIAAASSISTNLIICRLEEDEVAEEVEAGA